MEVTLVSAQKLLETEGSNKNTEQSAVKIIACIKSTTTGTPLLFVLLKIAGKQPSRLATNNPFPGPKIQAFTHPKPPKIMNTAGWV